MMRKKSPAEVGEVAKHILSNKPELQISTEDRESAYDYVIDLINIQEELYRYGIKSDDYGNPSNLGYQNGVLKFFDVGGYIAHEPTMTGQDIVYLPEDGSAKFSTDNAMGQDNFPTHNNIDNSPSIQNDLNANINIEEDLEYNHVDDATKDEYLMSERKLSSMAGSSTVDIKKKCRLGGLGNTSAQCNWGDINAVDIKPLKEEISASEAYTEQGAIKTVLNGKRKIGFVHINKSIAQKLEKLKIGVIPVRMTSQNTMTAIIYRDKIKAYLLYEITKRHGGYLDDKTPEEAREIGQLLEYKEEDIENFIRKNYGNKVPLMPDKSLNDFNDLAEEVAYDFWDLNENNIEDSIDMTTLNRGVGKDEPILVNDFPLNKLTVSKRGISASIQDINQKEPSKTDEPVLVFYNIEKQTFLVEDGYHRVAQAYLNKEKIIPVSIYSDNYSDYVANISPENKFELDEVSVKSDEKEEIYRDNNYIVIRPLTHFAARKYGCDTNWCTSVSNSQHFDYHTENKNFILYIINRNIKPAPTNIRNDKINNFVKLYTNGQWDNVEDNKKEKFLDYSRIAISVEYMEGEENAPDIRIFDANDFDLYEFTGNWASIDGLPIPQNIKTVIIDYIDKKTQSAEVSDTEMNEENHSEFEKDINQDLTTHRLDKKFIRNYQDGEHTYSVYAVNGDQVRDSGFIEWVDGGNHWVDADLPKDKQKYASHIGENEYWIDDVFMIKPADFEAILLHERTESFIIRHYGYEYDDAHEVANKIEMMFRKNIPNGANRAVAEKIYDTFVKNFKPKKDLEKDKPANESNEMLNEAQIMELNYLPFKEDVEEVGGKIYSIGGKVRDEFLGKESKDLDILITGVPFEQLEEILSKYGVVNAVGKSFGVLKFKPKGATEDIDVAIPRTETSTGEGGHQGFDVKSDHTLPIETDLSRRDFTLNAMAKDIEGNIIDPFGGQEDIKNKIIRVVNPQAFSDDPLRLLRAIQFASRFGFTIESETMKMIKDNASRVKEIAPERILTEFDKIIHKGNVLTGAVLLDETGLLKEIFGRGLYYDFRNTKEPFDKVRTMGEFIYLLSKNLISDPAEFYKNNLKGDENAYREIKALQIAFESGEATNLIEARSIAHNMYVMSPTSLQSQILPNVIKTAAQELLEGKYPKTVNELAVNGQDLMQAGLQGKAIGDMQKSLLLKVYSGNVMNNKEDLLSLAGENKKMIKEEKVERIEYGCLMLFLDVPIWSKITSIINKDDIYNKEGYGIEQEAHCTLLYGFHDEVTAEDVFDLYKENMPLKPIKVRVKGISIFENPDFDVVKFDVNSEVLKKINNIMKQLPNTSTFPDYHAHITIAYVKKGEGKKYIKPFEKERMLKGDELVYNWKGHKGKEGGEILSLNEKGILKEFAYPEFQEPKSTWNINGEQVDIKFFIEKYDIWNQGGYADPSEASVLEFLQNNYEDFIHDEKLKKELLVALTDRNVLDETVINEMSIKQINYDDVITPEYIRQIEMSDNYERFIESYQYEENMVDVDKEEIEKTEDFKNWFKYELSARYDDAVERITNNLKPDGTIDIWRRITVDDEENRWISHLADAGKHLGIYWSWDERSAEAHWGDTTKSSNALIKSSIKEEYIDWRNTLYANMDMSLGEDEREITLFKNTSLKIEELYIDNKDVMTSDFASAIKNKTFYA
jgi:tRNA nucleotidyltransferase/poly(A) polymerase